MGHGVLIVDDHPQFRLVARRLLESAGFDVVGEAGDAAEALTVAADVRPGLALVDIQLPDMDGFELTEHLLDEPDPPLVVLTSTRDASDYGVRLATSRARGFIAKAELSGTALRTLWDGGG